jgi:hypothetical protein
VETNEWEHHDFSEKLTVTQKKKNRRKHSFSLQYNDTISEPARKRTQSSEIQNKIGDSTTPTPQTNRPEGTMNPKCEYVHG